MFALLLTVLFATTCIFGRPIAHEEHQAYYDIPVGSCGLNKYMNLTDFIQPYIVGGKTTRPNAYPWQVSLQENIEPVCGGTIINELFILTAAHCFDGARRPETWEVVVGKHSLTKSEPGERTYQVEKVIVHKKYNSKKYLNDITLLKLAIPIEFTNDIQPACLPSADIGDLTGTDGTITGWGDTSEGGHSSSYLMETQVPIFPNDECQDMYYKEQITAAQFCAGLEKGGRDTCQGDSGGPMVILQDDKYTVVGVTSFGYGCGHRNKPGIYTRVSSFLDWIGQMMAAN